MLSEELGDVDGGGELVREGVGIVGWDAGFVGLEGEVGVFGCHCVGGEGKGGKRVCYIGMGWCFGLGLEDMRDESYVH